MLFQVLSIDRFGELSFELPLIKVQIQEEEAYLSLFKTAADFLK